MGKFLRTLAFIIATLTALNTTDPFIRGFAVGVMSVAVFQE